MLKFVLLVGCFIAMDACFAQQNTIDMLLTKLQRTQTNEPLKCKLLTQLAYQYQLVDATKGVAAASQAIELARVLKDDNLMADACISKGVNEHVLMQDSIAFELYRKAQNLYMQTKNNKGIADALFNTGIVYFTWSQYNKSIVQYKDALSFYKQLNDTVNVAKTLNSIGLCYQYSADYAKAIDSYLQAMQRVEKDKNNNILADIYTNLGITYSYLNSFDKALIYHQQALDVYKKTNQQKGMATALGNMGNVYDNMDDSANAIAAYTKALIIAKQLNDKRTEASNIANIGILYFYYDAFDKAIIYLQQATLIYKQLNDKTNLSLLLEMIADTYVNAPVSFLQKQHIPVAKRYQTAENYLRQSLQLSKETGNAIRQSYVYASLSSMYERQGHFAEALQNYKQYITLRDSAVNNKKKKEIERLEMQYAFDKKEADIKIASDKKQALTAAQMQQQHTFYNALLAVGGVVVIAGIVVFVFYKRKRDAVQQQQAAELKSEMAETEMKALRSQMNPHFIFNSLNSINDFFAKNNQPDASDYLTKFAKLMRLTLEHSEQKEITLKEDLQALTLYMQLEALRLHHKFTFDIQVDQTIDATDMLVPPLLLQPFVENSIWHGIAPKEEAGHIQITITKAGDMIHFTVEDNGIGRQKSAAAKPVQGNTTGTSLGMKITSDRIEMLNKIKKVNAAIEVIDVPGGTRAEITIPHTLSY